MSLVQFAVSAKTARLIGRENISDVNGAIIELIKNSYDADAKCVFLLLNIPFPVVPKTINHELCNLLFDSSEMSYLFEFYENSTSFLLKKNNLSAVQEEELNHFLFAKNSIVVMDNGCGMTEDILRHAWMNIGTSNKEVRRVSAEGRVKTGAKGIGRFALDKLSKATSVITKNKEDALKKWQIDWEQFETASLLDEVTATIEDCDGLFYDYAKEIAENRFRAFDNYNWDTGTIIKLTPARESWSENFFEKINKNLKSIFPGTNSSQFDIYVSNIFYPQYSFYNERFILDQSEYDYKISGHFDGKDTITVDIFRNEIDTRKLKVNLKINNQDKDIALADFWKREAFNEDKYIRSSFAKTVRYVYSANALTKIDSSTIQSVGPFDLEFYFLKNAPSTLGIVKPVVSSRRKDVLKNFSGIKLYRDGFKVRPYGEEDGPSFDWLSLGLRAQKSPAAVSHLKGSWRVRSNQIIGAVRITKDENPNLSDMANREGLAINESYSVFKTLIDKILEVFEYDRQYVFREYSIWISEQEDKFSKTSKIVEKIKSNENYSEQSKSSAGSTHSSNGDSSYRTDSEYSKEDYEKAILELEEKRKSQEQATKTMMLYSSAGVMTNTFSHEISRIMSQAGSRMQHLRAAIMRIVGIDGYKGHPSFDPFPIIDQTESVDKLLENWLAVITSGTDDKVFLKQDLNMYSTICKIVEVWKPLLEQKVINVLPVNMVGDEKSCICNLAEIDLIIILNNFMLNSSYFLEQIKVGTREINITIVEEKTRIVVNLENNGPPIDGIFGTNPDKIFEAGVSTKETESGKGSGIGLWITQTLVLDNSGEIHPIVKTDGFGLRICLPK